MKIFPSLYSLKQSQTYTYEKLSIAVTSFAKGKTSTVNASTRNVHFASRAQLCKAYSWQLSNCFDLYPF